MATGKLYYKLCMHTVGFDSLLTTLNVDSIIEESNEGHLYYFVGAILQCHMSYFLSPGFTEMHIIL